MSMIINPYVFATGGGSGVTPIIWNSADKAAYISLDESDKRAYNTVSGTWGSARSTTSYTTGSGGFLMFEVERLSSNGLMIGVMKAAGNLNSFVGSDTNGWGYYAGDGNKYTNSSAAAYGTALALGDKLRVKIYSNGDLEFFKNGSSLGNAFTGLSGTFYPAVSVLNSGASNGARAT